MAQKTTKINPLIFLLFLGFGYLLAKDLMGGFETYHFGFNNEAGSVWRARDSDGKLSYCVLTDWDKFPNSRAVCTEWSDDEE